MEQLTALWQKVWPALADPFRFRTDVNERIFIGYLGSSLLLAVFVFIYLRRTRPETPHSLLGFLFPKQV